MKRIVLLAFIIGFLASSCGNRTRNQQANDELDWADLELADGMSDNSMTSLDYLGTYEGVLPCADCEGIRTKLTLTECGKYNMESQYLGKGDTTIYVVEGPYVWTPDGSTIRLDGNNDGPMMFKVGEGQIWVLDREGNRIDGSLADHYILTKREMRKERREERREERMENREERREERQERREEHREEREERREERS